MPVPADFDKLNDTPKPAPTHYQLFGTVHEIKSRGDGTSSVVINTGPHFFQMVVVTAPKWAVGRQVLIEMSVL